MKINRKQVGYVIVCIVLLGIAIAYQNCGQVSQDSDPHSQTSQTNQLRNQQENKDPKLFQKPAAERGFAELIKDVGVIFEGRAVSSYSAYSKDKEAIYTFVTFEKQNVLKGTISESTIELRFLGGEMGEDVVKVVGMPRFDKGKKYILLLHDKIFPYLTISPVYGMEAGQFLIEQGKDKIEWMQLPSGAKIIGYDKEKDRLDTAYQHPLRKNIPKPHDPKQDQVVDENDSRKLAQPALTKNEFSQLIASIVKEQGLPGAEYRNMKEEEKLKPILLPIAPAPKVQEGKVQ